MSERETALKAVRLKAIKLLEALAERCERPEDEDHDCHTCRSCVAAFSLTQPGEKSLLRLLLDELMAAGADPVPVCQWRFTGAYFSGCGQEMLSTSPDPEEFKHCPYCGKPLALVPGEETK
jgi:hypothetical protein